MSSASVEASASPNTAPISRSAPATSARAAASGRAAIGANVAAAAAASDAPRPRLGTGLTPWHRAALGSVLRSSAQAGHGRHPLLQGGPRERHLRDPKGWISRTAWRPAASCAGAAPKAPKAQIKNSFGAIIDGL